jgi:hypothetical protein
MSVIDLPALSDDQLEDLAFEFFQLAAFASVENREAVEPSCVAILSEYRRRGLETMIEGLLIGRYDDGPWVRATNYFNPASHRVRPRVQAQYLM